MKTGEVIRMYRKNRNLTQEEMASRLGVTAPAVNKWENNVSLPDITLLAPIARLLETTPDTLLCFREELSQEEVNAFVQEADEKFQKEDYEQVFEFCRKKIRQYPGCDRLVVQLAAVLDGWRILKKIPEEEKYDREILGWYKQALESQDAEIKERAAEALFSYYFRKEQYEEAGESSRGPEGTARACAPAWNYCGTGAWRTVLPFGKGRRSGKSTDVYRKAYTACRAF